MKKTVKKTVKKATKKTVKAKAYAMPQISTAMATETLLARMIDMEDRNDRVAVMTEYLKGADRSFGSAVLQRMTRGSVALMLEAAGVATKPAVVDDLKGMVNSMAGGALEGSTLPVTLVSAVSGSDAPQDNPINQRGVTTQVIVGPYSSKWKADQDVLQFRHPKVMAYRSTVFPSPSTHGVVATVTDAETLKLTDHPALMPKQHALAAAYPYAIRITVGVAGDAKKVGGWITAFERVNHFTKVG